MVVMVCAHIALTYACWPSCQCTVYHHMASILYWGHCSFGYDWYPTGIRPVSSEHMTKMDHDRGVSDRIVVESGS